MHRYGSLQSLSFFVFRILPIQKRDAPCGASREGEVFVKSWRLLEDEAFGGGAHGGVDAEGVGAAGEGAGVEAGGVARGLEGE